jgi:pimeloyl-ACP methyl ester carboxylesterase
MLTIVLVHGAFADASSWNGVIERLQRRGHTVVAPPNPLRGLEADSAYIASVVKQIDGPVLLVGHSYAGAVISNVSGKASNVAGLVFVAAFAPDDGEWLGDVAARSKDAILGPALLQRQYPTGRDGETAVEFIVNPSRFHDIFAQTCRRSAPPCWRQPSVPSPRAHSARNPDVLTGRRFHPGQWSQPVTRPHAPTSFAQWRSGQARR